MNEVMAIAESVWHRILRMKVLYFLVACAIVEISITSLYEILMANEHRMLMVDASLMLTTLSALLCVLALAFDIPKELREGTIAALLSKPLGRTQYLVGKFVGICGVGIVVTTLISIGFCAVHNAVFDDVPIAAIEGHVLTIASVIPMAALALFFASLLGEAAAAVLTAAAVWFAHSVPILSKVKILYGGLIPDMNLFNLRAEVTYNTSIGWGYVGLAALWGVIYAVGLVSLTGIVFNRRDLR